MKSIKKKLWNQVTDPIWVKVWVQVETKVRHMVRHQGQYPIDSQAKGEVCIMVYHEIS